MNLTFSKESTLPESFVPGRIYFTEGGIYVALSETTLERYSVSNIEDLENRISTIETAQANKTVTLRSYLFGVSGTYTKDSLETLLGMSLQNLVSQMSKGSPIVLFSMDSSSANISFIIESNYTLDENSELNTLTLMWHQYQLWNTLSVAKNTDGTYTLTNTTE